VKLLKYFFSHALLKIDRFLINSNKRCESENKGATSSTCGKSVKQLNIRGYDNYLDFGFTSTEVDGAERDLLFCKIVTASAKTQDLFEIWSGLSALVSVLMVLVLCPAFVRSKAPETL
jgi:hypothetical protein